MRDVRHNSHVWHASFRLGDINVMWHDSFTCVTWFIQIGSISLWLFTCVTWLIHVCDITHMCDMTHPDWVDIIMNIRKRDVTHSSVWHDSCICVAWLMYTCDLTHSYAWHDPLTCVAWPIHTRDMTHSDWADIIATPTVQPPGISMSRVVYMSESSYAHTHTQKPTRKHTHMHTHIHKHTHTHSLSLAHAHTHIHTHNRDSDSPTAS